MQPNMQPNMQPLRTPIQAAYMEEALENKEAAEAEIVRAEASKKAATADAEAFLAEAKAAMKLDMSVAAYKAVTHGAQQALDNMYKAKAEVVEAWATVEAAKSVA
jgi:hypothetical protein